MALPASGAISFSDIRTEFGDTGSISYADLYRGGSIVEDNYSNTDSIPTSGVIDLQDFYGVRQEGTAQDKLTDFQTYRLTNLVYRGVEGVGDDLPLTADTFHINNPVSRYLTSYTLAVPSTDRTSQHSSSQWTTLIGFVGGSATNVAANAIDTGTESYRNTSVTNDCLVVNHINNIHRDLAGAINFTHSRSASNAGAWPTLCIVPGKWEFVSTTAVAPFTLAAGRIAVAAYDRGGDGGIGYYATANPSAGFSCTRNTGHWYNNGGGMIMANNSAVSQTVTISPNIAEDTIWILEEVL